MQTPLGHTHHFVPGPAASQAMTLLLLHGTGGNENDLLDVGRVLAPDANLLGVRGKVLENGAPRFFRRLAEGVFDLEDLKLRTHELAGFVEAAALAYEFDPGNVAAVGYSNGANIAGALLLLRPGLLARAVLFHPMVPLIPETIPDLAGTPIFIGAGRQDPIAPPPEAERLAGLLRSAGADVSVHWEEGGHSLSRPEVEAARAWREAEK